MEDADELPFKFDVSGIDLRMLLKRLKPGFPRSKKTVAASRAQMILTTTGELLVKIPGAQSNTACHANANFTAELPLAEIVDLFKEKFHDSEQVTFAFGPGQMQFRSLTFSNGSIRAWRDGEQPDPLPQAADLMDTGIGLPLLATYHTLRRHPNESFTGNPVLGPAKIEIDSILTKSAKLLAPLGVDRTRLEQLLDSLRN